MNEKFFTLSQEKQDRIVNAAFQCFAENGYRRTVTDDIAAQAGISKGLLFHYFGNKRTLYDYLFQYGLQFVGERLRALYDWEREDLFAVVLRSAKVKAEIVREYPFIFRFIMNAYYEEHGETGERIKEIYGDVVKRSMEQMMQKVDWSRLKAGVDARQLLNVVIWCAEGFMLERQREGTAGDPDCLCRDFEAPMQMLRDAFYESEPSDPI